MDQGEAAARPAWRVGYSIALELDTALSLVNGYFPAASLTPDLAALVESTAEDWRAEARSYLGPAGRQTDILQICATLAGVLCEVDYSPATLAMRGLTLAEARARLAGEPGREERTNGAGDAALAALVASHETALYRGAGFSAEAAAIVARRTHEEAERISLVLADGDLHDRFWHWLDRFYYETYAPWRRTRSAALTAAERRAQVALAGQAAGSLALDWLPAQSPLLRYPELAAAVREGRLDVCLWVEPFGVADYWSLYRPAGQAGRPTLMLSFAQPGELYQNFLAWAADVAGRSAALGDPTRLIILRLIRHFGMINTEIADYLGLARPTVSIHTKVLRDAGLIRSHQAGREVRHEIARDELERLFDDLRQFLDLS